MIKIPLIAVPNQQLLITLDNQDCTLHVYQRGDKLYLDLALDGEILRYGAVCLPGVQIGGDMLPFTGYIIVTDELSSPDKQLPPSYEGLGTRYFMYYCSEEEADEIVEEGV